jgi:hypothetical protein
LRLEKAEDVTLPPQVWFANLRLAAEAGVAPGLRYADAGERLVIQEFLDAKPLPHAYPGPRAALITHLARRVRQLHAAPLFAPAMDYLPGMEGVLGYFGGMGGLSPPATEAALAVYRAVREAYRERSQDRVSSHNDLHPRNVLYDGAEIWFVDWEVAFATDRYADIACLANSFARGDEEAALLLATYLGRAPDEQDLARFHLMRQVNSVFYGVALANLAAAERPGLRLDSFEGASLAEVGQAIGAGRLSLDAPDGRLEYARARLKTATDNAAAPAFAAALATVARER